MSIGIGVWKVGKRWWGAAGAEEDRVRGGKGDFKKGQKFQRSTAKRREFQSNASTFVEHIGSIKREKWNK